MGDPAQLAAMAALTPEQVATLTTLMNNLNVQPRRGNALPHIKNIPWPQYVIGQDFQAWLTGFVDNVRCVYDLPEGDDRIPALLLKWIVTKLSSGPTRAAYDNLDATIRADWVQLKAALSECYLDENDKLTFLSRLDAHRRLPGQSLRAYKDTLLMKMSKYQPQLRTIAEEWRRTSLQRFREGLNNPLLKAHLMLVCPDASADIEEAFKAATAWENTINQIGKETKGSNAESLVSAMMGLPTASQATTVTPIMAGLGSSDDAVNRRFGALETKVRQNELHIAEVKDSISCVKASMDEMKKDLNKGFSDLRQDLAAPRQRAAYTPQPAHQQRAYAQQPAYNQRPMQQSYQQRPFQSGQNFRPNAAAYTPAFQGNSQSYRAPFPNVRPATQAPLVAGLTPGSSYVNNQLPSANQPSSNTQYQQPRDSNITIPKSQPTLGAVGGATTGSTQCENLQCDCEETPICGNIGNGWEAFPGCSEPEGYDSSPLGINAFGEADFLAPVDPTQGSLLA